MDERIKAYYDALVEKRNDLLQTPYMNGYCAGLSAGKRSGLDFALEIFKSMFDLAEYAKGARDDRVDL